MKRVKRSKKRDERNDDVNDPFIIIPTELKVEILMKLPPRSIARLRFASKHLSSIILGKEFTELYMTRSSTQPRHLVSVHRGSDMQLFHSFSQEEHPSASNDHDKVSYTLDPDVRYVFTPPVRGLICGRNGIKMMIGNPSTGQFVSLPRVKTRKKDILSIFGYDPVNDVYKVLCLTVITRRGNIARGIISRDYFLEDVMAWEAVMSEEHQVITLGAKQKWRMIKCKYPHRHYSGYHGICRDGALYYLTSYKQKRSLMCFDLSSEEFNVTKLPDDYSLQEFGNLVNHSGKITIAVQAYDGPIDLWVQDDVNKEVWSKTASVVPSMNEIFGGDQRFMFRGILPSGEVIFKPLPSPNPFFFICYDPKEKKVRQVEVDGIRDDSAAIQVYFDHVESCMVL
ncbi:F-box/kelch-repeat protein [Raphanus sativus]|uniref:F-box/kelch-repeat protein At3g04660 n=1 Tax=Raphanus sativus TaxID=3726 RepID=A0A6J0L5D1_RAPSA|nr:F-box/kelch-repeat protein At3g04660 [Raphanus sativus]KAJ4876982.1 F-box/kelch-repeat protein [Raphanus sativus]